MIDKVALHEQLMAKHTRLQQLLTAEASRLLDEQVATDLILCELRAKLKLLESHKYDPDSEIDQRIQEVRAKGYRKIMPVGKADLKALQRMVAAGIAPPDLVEKAARLKGETASLWDTIKDEMNPLLRQQYKERREKKQALCARIKAREKELRGASSAEISQLQDDLEQIQQQLDSPAEDVS